MPRCNHGKPKKHCHQCNRRLVTQITTYLQPKQIHNLITGNGWPYAWDRNRLQCRDRSFMGTSFGSAGRVTAICGGSKLFVFNKCEKCEGLVRKVRVEDSFRWICDECGVDYGRIKPKNLGKLQVVDEYEGITRKNLTVTDKFIIVSGMKVVKRTQKLVAKRGIHVTLRDDFRIPLQKGLYETEYGDQLVPFGWLILEYLERFKPKGRLFPFKRCRAWGIIHHVTDKFPNWFRSQAEDFYGNYLMRDSVKLAEFVKVQNPAQVKRYIHFSYDSLLKDSQQYMDFAWIDPAVEQIKERMT